MTTISELSTFIEREKVAAAAHPVPPPTAPAAVHAAPPALEASEPPALTEASSADATPEPAEWPIVTR